MRRSWFSRGVTLMGAVSLGLGLLQLSVPAVAAPLSSGRAWTIQPSPDKPGATASQLDAVACLKDGPCAAVGTYYTGRGEPEHQFPLALRRTGTKWVIEATPSPKGVGYGLLSGVSCVSASSCIAVGYTVTSTTNGVVAPLAERWNGTSWLVKSPARPGGRNSWAVLDDVSCPTAAFCLAVGGFIKNLVNGQEQPLAEEWNGSSWRQLTAPNPHAENGSELTSVACRAATCEATGDYGYADVAESVFAYRFNGSAWATQKQVNPGGQDANSESSLSCYRASACTSVGYWTSNGPLALAERWDGASWSRQSLPRPAKSVTDELSGVSCPAAAACTAVGSSAANYNDYPSVTMAMTWNGASWRLASTPAPAGKSSGLNGVSCTAPADCVAVGAAGTSTLVEVSPAG